MSPEDAILFQLDAAGGPLWGKRWGAPDRRVGAYAVALDGQGHIAIAGDFGGGTLNLGFGDVSKPGVGTGSYVMLLQADGEYITNLNGPAFEIPALQAFVDGWLVRKCSPYPVSADFGPLGPGGQLSEDVKS